MMRESGHQQVEVYVDCLGYLSVLHQNSPDFRVACDFLPELPMHFVSSHVVEGKLAESLDRIVLKGTLQSALLAGQGAFALRAAFEEPTFEVETAIDGHLADAVELTAVEGALIDEDVVADLPGVDPVTVLEPVDELA
jgi:hypothetical protein